MPRAKLGMAMFLLHESVFFFMLILAFVYFRNASVKTASAGLNFQAAAIYTVCLLASSFTMWRAVASGGRPWLAITIVLGSLFVFGQGHEYVRLYRHGVTLSQGLFGTTFFTLTGIHGLHVLIGILLLAIVLGLATAGDVGERQSIAVQTVAMYWHFVDLVWLVIFSIVYLWTLI